MNTGTIEDEINLRQFVVMKGEAWKDQVEFFCKKNCTYCISP